MDEAIGFDPDFDVMDIDMPATLEVPFDPLANLPTFLIPLRDSQTTRDTEFPLQLGPPNSLQLDVNDTVVGLKPATSSAISVQPTHATSDTPRINKRKRNNQIVLEGNNKAGRQGKPRCGNCRKRHSKCIYTSEDSQCESCRTHGFREPCIKKWGPKRQARLVPLQRVSVFDTSTGEALVSLSRPISSHQFDADIDPMYPYIFQWGYSADPLGFYLKSRVNLVKALASAFGPLIQHSSLQHAICATIVDNFPIGLDKHLYVGRARKSLYSRLNDPTIIDEGDLFATALLAMLDWGNAIRYETHVNGFLAIMRHLYNRSNGNLKSYQLSALWTTVTDLMLVIVVEGNQAFADLPDFAISILRLSEESQRMREQIGPIYRQPSAIGWVSHWFAGCLETLATQPNTVPFKSYILSSLATMKADVSLEERCNTERSINQNSSDRRNGRAAVAALCGYLLPLVVSVLNAPTIDQGLSSSIAIRSASAFFTFIRYVENTIPRTANDFTKEVYLDSDDEDDISFDWQLAPGWRIRDFWEIWDKILGAIDTLFPWVRLCEVSDVKEVGDGKRLELAFI